MLAFVAVLAADLPAHPVAQTVTVTAPRATLKLEVADTPAAREYGLMFRTHLASHGGMIFVFAFDGPQQFWMKNTLIPLDMIWVRADGTVDSVAANVPASRVGDDNVAIRDGHGKYVIELAAGEAQRAGLHPGLKLSLPHLEPRDSGTS